jgi:hypothetical protein
MEALVKTDEDVAARAFAPDEAWIEAFTQQNTSELREQAKRYAARRTRRIGEGATVDELDLRALVQDALTDTLFGQIAWDPATTPLRQHVLDTIRYRTRHARKRARRFVHQRVDVFDPRAEGSAAMSELEGSLRVEQTAPTSDELTFAEQVLARLRALAARDGDVLRLIDAIGEGACEPSDIMAVGRLTPKQYRNARERLDRLVQGMDHELDRDLRS